MNHKKQNKDSNKTETNKTHYKHICTRIAKQPQNRTKEHNKQHEQQKRKTTHTPTKQKQAINAKKQHKHEQQNKSNKTNALVVSVPHMLGCVFARFGMHLFLFDFLCAGMCLSFVC